MDFSMVPNPKFDGPPPNAFVASTNPIDAVPSAATAAMMLPRLLTRMSAGSVGISPSPLVDPQSPPNPPRSNWHNPDGSAIVDPVFMPQLVVDNNSGQKSPCYSKVCGRKLLMATGGPRKD